MGEATRYGKWEKNAEELLYEKILLVCYEDTLLQFGVMVNENNDDNANNNHVDENITIKWLTRNLIINLRDC